MPWDSRAEGESAELGAERDSSSASLSADWQAQQERMGLGAGANNPYSEAAMLKQQRDASARGAVNAAGNQLYSGSAVNAQRDIASEYDRSRAGLESQFAAGQAAFGRESADLARNYELGMAKIKEGALNRALESEPSPMPVGGRGGRRSGAPRRVQPAGRRSAIPAIGGVMVAGGGKRAARQLRRRF